MKRAKNHEEINIVRHGIVGHIHRKLYREFAKGLRCGDGNADNGQGRCTSSFLFPLAFPEMPCYIQGRCDRAYWPAHHGGFA